MRVILIAFFHFIKGFVSERFFAPYQKAKGCDVSKLVWENDYAVSPSFQPLCLKNLSICLND